MKYTTDGIVLSPGKYIYRKVDRNSTTYYKIENISKYYWTDIAEISEDFTLRDFFQFIQHTDANRWEEILGLSTSVYVKEGLNKEPDYSDYTEGETLEVYQVVEVDKDETIESWYGFHSVLDGEEYSISLCPTNQLSFLPLKFRVEVSFIECLADYSCTQKILTRNTPITLIEFARAIFHELNFYGTPQQKDVSAQKLISSIEEAIQQPGEVIQQPIGEWLQQIVDEDDSEED